MPWHGGPILVTFEAGCAWSSRRGQCGTRWEVHPDFAPWWAFSTAGGEAEGDGGGLLANTRLNIVGTHLKGPVTVLLVLVGHSEGARQAGREGGVVGKQM